MHFRFPVRVAMLVIGMLLSQAGQGHSEHPKPKHASDGASTPEQGRQTVERSLVFLEKDAVRWRKDRQCATCHHGAMTVWTFSEAKHQGYAVGVEVLAEMVKWTKGRFVPAPDQPADLRPGYNIPSLAAVYLTLSTWTQRDGVAQEELNRIAKHITDRQEADGSWPVPPPANGPHPVFESRETMSLWFYLALEQSVPADAKEPSIARTSREKAAAWLSKAKPGDTTQTVTLRLLVEVRSGKSPNLLQAGIDRLLSRQNADGGWSQINNLPSDAYATGQALYVLSLAGVAKDRPQIRRAVSFLVANQRADGSWPMTSRETPERKASKNPVPIVYFGSAWATLGLMRSLPKGQDKPATPAEQYQPLLKEYQDASSGGAASDDERMNVVARVYKLRYKLPLRFLELAES